MAYNGANYNTNANYNPQRYRRRNGNARYAQPMSPYTGYPDQERYDQAHTAGYFPVPNTTPGTMQYQVAGSQLPPQSMTVPSQNDIYNPHPTSAQHFGPSTNHHFDWHLLAQTEEQDCPNGADLKSVPLAEQLVDFPDMIAFDALIDQYILSLSPKKRDKALIHAKRVKEIRRILNEKKSTDVRTAQFRFWAKKMFIFVPADPTQPHGWGRLFSKGKPVAVREKLFRILTRAHRECQHGGRDKTSAQVRRTYSYVPKELIARFVKLCPHCQKKRPQNKPQAPKNKKGPAGSPATANSEDTVTSPTTTVTTRHDSFVANFPASATNFPSSAYHSPISMADQSQLFRVQNRWMTNFNDFPGYEADTTEEMEDMDHHMSG